MERNEARRTCSIRPEFSWAVGSQHLIIVLEKVGRGGVVKV